MGDQTARSAGFSGGFCQCLSLARRGWQNTSEYPRFRSQAQLVVRRGLPKHLGLGVAQRARISLRRSGTRSVHNVCMPGHA